MNDFEKTVLEKIYQPRKRPDSTIDFGRLQSLMVNHAFKPLNNGGSLIGRIKVFIKRVIRKLTKFYVEPIAFQQTDFNVEVVKSIEKLKKQIDNEKENNSYVLNRLANLIDELADENISLKAELSKYKNNQEK